MATMRMRNKYFTVVLSPNSMKSQMGRPSESKKVVRPKCFAGTPTFILAILLLATVNESLKAQTVGNYFQWVIPPPVSPVAFIGDKFVVSAYVNCSSWDTSLRSYASYINHPNCTSVGVPGATWKKELTATSTGAGTFTITGACAGSAHHPIRCTDGWLQVYPLSEKLASVSVISPTQLLSHTSTQLTLMATSVASTTWYDNQANWSVSPGTLATISSSGLLTIGSTATGATLTVSVSYEHLSIIQAATQQIVVTPNATTTTPVPVPYFWLDNYPALLSAHGGIYDDTANATGDNGKKIWESYVAGLTPTNNTSQFLSMISLSNGLPVITWDPNLGTQRVYTLTGKTNLADMTWGTIDSSSRFFRVGVSLP